LPESRLRGHFFAETFAINILSVDLITPVCFEQFFLLILSIFNGKNMYSGILPALMVKVRQKGSGEHQELFQPFRA
jgi:hypothetical protein